MRPEAWPAAVTDMPATSSNPYSFIHVFRACAAGALERMAMA